MEGEANLASSWGLTSTSLGLDDIYLQIEYRSERGIHIYLLRSSLNKVSVYTA